MTQMLPARGASRMLIAKENTEAGSKFSGFLKWWHSPWGPGPLLGVALPLMISAGFMSITLFTDRTLLYWDSEASAAAAMSGGTLYWTALCFPTGLLGYVATFVAQYVGARQFQRIGSVYRHGIVIAWGCVPFVLLMLLLADKVFIWSGHQPRTVELEAGYLRILLLGGIGVLFYSVQSGVLTGEGRTRTVLAIDAVATLVNLLLNAVLIFGFGPIPALGLWGAAIATTCSFWIKVPIAHWLLFRSQVYVEERGFQRKLGTAWEPQLISRIIRFGSPAGLQMLAESFCFTIILLQVGRLGELEMAATTLALGLNILAFVPLIGLGIGVGVLVGQRPTEGRVDLAKRAVTCALCLSVCYTSGFALMLGLAPRTMLSLYALGASVERFAEIEPLILPLLGIIAVYCVLDGLQIVFVGAIKGAGDTWFVLLATLLISVGVVVAGLLMENAGYGHLNLWWYVIALWIALMGIAFGSRYASGAWQSKRVIEDAGEPN